MFPKSSKLEDALKYRIHPDRSLMPLDNDHLKIPLSKDIPQNSNGDSNVTHFNAYYTHLPCIASVNKKQQTTNLPAYNRCEMPWATLNFTTFWVNFWVIIKGHCFVQHSCDDFKDLSVGSFCNHLSSVVVRLALPCIEQQRKVEASDTALCQDQ